MNREQLYKKHIDDGATVPLPEKWVETSNDGKYAEYEVSVSDSNGKTGIAIVGIKNPNEINNEGTNIESAKVVGWKREPVPFDIDLRNFLNKKEEEIASVYAIRVDDIHISDEVAEVTVYTISTNDVTSNKYVVVRRNQLFDFKKLV